MIAEKCLIRFEDVYEYAFKGTNCGKLEDEDFDAIVNAIESVSAVDAVEVVHGHWEHENCDTFHCSVCGYVDAFPHMDEGIRPHKYCPDCGAKMDGGADNGI